MRIKLNLIKIMLQVLALAFTGVKTLEFWLGTSDRGTVFRSFNFFKLSFVFPSDRLGLMSACMTGI